MAVKPWHIDSEKRRQFIAQCATPDNMLVSLAAALGITAAGLSGSIRDLRDRRERPEIVRAWDERLVTGNKRGPRPNGRPITRDPDKPVNLFALWPVVTNHGLNAAKMDELFPEPEDA